MRRLTPLMLLLILLFAAAAPPATAQVPEPDIETVFSLINEGRFVRAREVAEQTLRRDRDSVIGNYLMGVAMHRGEANLPLARHYLERAYALAERSGFYDADEDRVLLRANILVEMQEVAHLMDRDEDRIRLVDELNQRFGIDYVHWTGWSRMKLGRIDEARALMGAYARSEDPTTRGGALNTLGAIEALLGNYEESFRWFTLCKDDLDARTEPVGYVTCLSNRAETAIALLRFQEAESDLLLAARHFHPSSAVNPWRLLAFLYAAEGRLPESLDALRKMHRWNRRSLPNLEQQRWGEGQQMTAAVLLAAGYDKEALDILRKIRRMPDRRGTTSGSAEQAEVGLLHLYREALSRQRERLREEMSWSAAGAWLSAFWERLKVERELWEADSRLNALLVAQGRLAWFFRPYAPDAPLIRWLRPAAGLGDGLAQAELAKLLARRGEDAKRERPYLRAALGETLATKGEYGAALPELRAALASLPKEEALLRARVEACVARAQERRGDAAAATAAYRGAMERDPGALRSLGLSLPVTFAHDGSEAARRAARLLEKSPRLHRGPGFRLMVTTEGNSLRARLSGRDGATFAQVSVPLLADAQLAARSLCQEAHRRVFAPKIDLSQADIGSLDGSTVSGGLGDLQRLLGIREEK